MCEVFHHVLLKYGHETAEMQKRKLDDVTLWYSIALFYHQVHSIQWCYYAPMMPDYNMRIKAFTIPKYLLFLVFHLPYQSLL